MRITIQSLVVLLVATGLAFASAAPIGIAKGSGDFRLDSAVVRSNATVLDGSTLEAGASRLQVVLNDGARLMLTESSRGKLYSDHAVLERGATELAGAGKYRVEALSLKVAPDSEASVAQIDMNKSNRVVVTAKSGVVKVTNSTGVLVAMVLPGKALEFDPQAGGTATATKISGVLQKKNGKFLLTDTTTNVTFEIQGADLGKYVGKRVAVTGMMLAGATPAPGAAQVIAATLVTPMAKVAGAAAAGAAAAGAAKGGVIAGLSTAATVAVVGGVAAAGTVGGLAAAGTFSGDDNVSRR